VEEKEQKKKNTHLAEKTRHLHGPKNVGVNYISKTRSSGALTDVKRGSGTEASWEEGGVNQELPFRVLEPMAEFTVIYAARS